MKACKECGSVDGYHYSNCQTGAEEYELRMNYDAEEMDEVTAMGYMDKERGKPTQCPYCGSELHPPVHENGWGDEDGHRPLDKHVCKSNPSHTFYVLG